MEWGGLDDDGDYDEVIEPINRQVYDVLSPNNKIKHDLIRKRIIERNDGNIDESIFPPDQWQGSLEGNTSIDIEDILDDTEMLGGIDPENIQLRTVYSLVIKDDDDRRTCPCNAYILGAQNDKGSIYKYLYVKFTDNAADPGRGERYYKIDMQNIKSIGPALTETARGRKRSRKTKRKKNKRKRNTKKRKRL
jgi:hypothetical protein